MFMIVETSILNYISINSVIMEFKHAINCKELCIIFISQCLKGQKLH